MAQFYVSFILLLSQSLGNDMDNKGSSQDTCPYLFAQTWGIGDSGHVMLGGLSDVERGKQESRAGGRDTSNTSNSLRKPL